MGIRDGGRPTYDRGTYRKNQSCLLYTSGIRSIAFPSISTVVYSFPVELAAKIAVHTVNRFLQGTPAVSYTHLDVYKRQNVHNTSNHAGKKRNLIRGLCSDIKDVSFSLDSKIFGENFEVLQMCIRDSHKNGGRFIDHHKKIKKLTHFT